MTEIKEITNENYLDKAAKELGEISREDWVSMPVAASSAKSALQSLRMVRLERSYSQEILTKCIRYLEKLSAYKILNQHSKLHLSKLSECVFDIGRIWVEETRPPLE